jgi:hypothetical protein
VKLAVRKMEGSIPGGGFHYLLHPFEVPEREAPLWSGMGYELVDVEDTKGERLLGEAREALRHQLEVAYLVDGPPGTKGLRPTIHIDRGGLEPPTRIA